MPKVRMLDVKNRRVIDPALELARKDDLIRELQEAAEFEARVAALLAEIMPKALADPWFIENAKHITADATLKWARLSIEEEMDANI